MGDLSVMRGLVEEFEGQEELVKEKISPINHLRVADGQPAGLPFE